MESSTITRLLSTIANLYEVQRDNHCKMTSEAQVKYFRSKFPTLTSAQLKHIQRILA